MPTDEQPSPPLRGIRLPNALGAAAVFIAIAAFVFHRQWLYGDRFVGNFDRLNGGSLPVRLLEARSLQAADRVPDWYDNVFMGLHLRVHGGIHAWWSSLSWLYAHVPESWFMPLAALVVAALLVAAMLGAFAALRRLGFRFLSTSAGAVCYGCSALITLRLA